ncbi:lantibiotic dehydratase C-terminal domain-containing protein [Streptomyces sp. NPDC059176]|uniref:lantibiotic dehydratase C-terminal domain-containing protein n=1 Tax=unclassified Streptomyces TaxID=2593676 RepID=UPI00368BBEB1
MTATGTAPDDDRNTATGTAVARSGREWLEVALSAPPKALPDLLRSVVRPLLAGPPSGAAPPHAFFLRGTGPAQPLLSVQIAQEPPRSVWGTECTERATRLAAHLDGVEVTTGPARLVPLAGSAFGGRALAPVTRDFLAEASPAVLSLVTAGERGRPALLASAAHLMAAHLRGATAAGAPTAQDYEEGREGVPLGFLSYRSHAEAFVASSRDPEGARKALDAQYARVAPDLERTVAAVLAQCEGRGPLVSRPARDWYEAVRAAKPVATGLFATGTDLVLTEEPAETDVHALDGSTFHRIVSASDGLRDFLDREPSFLSTRLLTSLLYACLHSAGISLAERYFLCYSVSRACEAIFRTDALAVLSTLADAQRF